MTSELSPSPQIARVRALTLALALVAALLLLTIAPAASAAPPPHASNERAFTVMSRNLYLGATLSPLFPDPPLTDQGEVFAAATAVWHQVRFTDYPTRAGALADEIAATTPDIIGLQEVTLYRIQPLFDPTAPVEVRMDFLEILQAELAARGLHYRVESSQAAFDGVLPAMDWDGATPVNVRLTDRDVILVRSGPQTANMRITNQQSGVFDAALTLAIAGQPLPIVRGWTAIDVAYRGRSFRVINTHLEAFAQPIAQAQAQELLAGPADTSMPVILIGDFNSAPGEAAYAALAEAGFADPDVGGPMTCCFDAALADPSSTLHKRIDLILHRGPLTVRSVQTVGLEPFQDTAPLWASDHAGLVAELVIR